MVLELRAEQEEIWMTASTRRCRLRPRQSRERGFVVARSRERALEEYLREAAKGQTAAAGQAEVQLRDLERQAAANRSLYESFLTPASRRPSSSRRSRSPMRG